MKKFSFWNLLTFLSLTATVVLVVALWTIFKDPGSVLNPFPNPTSIATISIPPNNPTSFIENKATSVEESTATTESIATETPSIVEVVTAMADVPQSASPTDTNTPGNSATSTASITPGKTTTGTKTTTLTSSATRTITLTATITSTVFRSLTNTFIPTIPVVFSPTVVIPTLTYTPKPPSATNTPASGSGCNGGDSSFESAVLSMVNYQRAQAGASPLSASSALTSAARNHSQDMATNNFFSHTGSNGSSPFNRMSAAGFSYSSAAENIYAGNGGNNSASAAVSAWMGSEGHRINMLNPTYTHAGVGYWCNANSSYGGYFTLDLAKP